MSSRILVHSLGLARFLAPGAAGAILLATAAGAAGTPAPTLRIGTADDYAPFADHGRGFDVDVAEALAKDLGARIDWVHFRWPELAATMREDRVDVAMGGITWKPDRAVVGWTTRAVAQGGPCVVGDPRYGPVVVNRGGVLERFARARFGDARVLAVDDNGSLAMLLAGGAATAFVTDSFELRTWHLPPDTATACDPPRERKVYWIAPARAAELGPRIDAWIAEHEPLLRKLRARWMGEEARREGIDDLVDRVARRLELMPAVAAYKRAHALPIEDAAREARVLEHAETQARSGGLDPASIRALFGIQIELAKAVERRAGEGPALDLDRELRPALIRIGDDIVARLAELAPIAPSSISDDRLLPLRGLLEEREIETLRAAMLAVRRANR